MIKGNTLLRAIALLLLTSIVITGCKKYDEGGPIGKADKHLKKSWRIDKYYRNGTDETSKLLISNFREEFKDGSVYIRSYIDKDGKASSESGNWQFDNDKFQINLSGVGSIDLTDETSTVSTSDYNILRLKKDELWYFFQNGGDRHDFHMVP